MGTTFIVLAIVFMIGVSIFVMTQNVTETVINDTNNALVNDVSTYGGNAITTFVQFLPILAIAIVGGIAIMYLMGFMGGQGRR